MAFGPEVELGEVAFIHPSVHIYGKARLAAGVSMWTHSVIRAEGYHVEIGEDTNIQDFVMIHVGEQFPTIIGSHCSITHHCTIHGCTIGDNCLIGVNTTIMDGCVVGENSIVAGGSFLKEGTIIPPNSIVMGTPGKVTRTVNNWVKNRFNAYMYKINGEHYARGHHRAWARDGFQEEAHEVLEALKKEFVQRYGAAQ